MKADEWNEKVKPGAAVIVTEDNGCKTYTKTRSEAWDLGDHATVVLLKGRTGGFNVDRIVAV